MVAALTYSIIPPLIIGHFQMKWAETVHEKTVHVDAKMSKADWMTGLAGAIGVLGVGLGFWWADALAALVIGLDVAKDGITNLKEAVGDLLDRRPRSIQTGKASGMEEKLESELEKLPWVKRAGVRLREEGHVLCGEAFVVPSSDADLTQHFRDASRSLVQQDWRLLEMVITSVPSLEEDGRKYFSSHPIEGAPRS